MTNSIIDDKDLDFVDPEKDYYSELVGADKKYKTNQDLGRTVVEKDAYIKRLERENAEKLEDIKQLQTTKNLEDILNQIEVLRTQPPSNGNNQRREAEQMQTTGLTSAEVEALIQKREMVNQQRVNRESVQKKLRETYGKDYVSKVEDAATQLGMTIEHLDSVAVQNPNAFYRLMGMDQTTQRKADDFSPPKSRLNFDSSTSSSGKKNFAYYEDMRKKKPSEYHSIKIQNEMHNEALAAYERGEDFYA
jgi:hypothetical protein